MTIVSPDRWTCSRCGRTTVVDGSDADTRIALNAVRDHHGEGHDPHRCSPTQAGRRTADTLARLGLDEPGHPTRRTPKGRRNQAARRS